MVLLPSIAGSGTATVTHLNEYHLFRAYLFVARLDNLTIDLASRWGRGREGRSRRYTMRYVAFSEIKRNPKRRWEFD